MIGKVGGEEALLLPLQLCERLHLRLQAHQLLLHLLHFRAEPLISLLLGPELLRMAFLGQNPRLLALQLFLFGNQLFYVLKKESLQKLTIMYMYNLVP
jgi:hypothetical protein